MNPSRRSLRSLLRDRTVLLLPLFALLTACSVGSVAAPVAPKVDVATADMAAERAAAGVDPCDTYRPTDSVGEVTPLPKVTLPCLGGGDSLPLGAVFGPFIINVFQAGCQPCQQEMPILQAWHEQHPGIPLIGIDGNDPLPGVALHEAITYGARYPLFADPDGKLQGTKLTVTGYPWFFFVAGDGTVTSKSGGMTSPGQFETLVEQNLGVS